MIASLVFATFLCTVSPDGNDKCETAYLETWQGVSSYHADKKDCLAELKALFPGDGIRANKETQQYQFAGCYRVLPGEAVGLPKDAVYLINVDESQPDSADDSFTDFRSKLELN